jgi:hypothetical protein
VPAEISALVAEGADFDLLWQRGDGQIKPAPWIIAGLEPEADAPELPTPWQAVVAWIQRGGWG